ncbi:MAG: DUF904 domain-containing protein [Burkholderiales bacterium]|nr:DUF904 domain-containing protein [Burkholderiales bacterium]
MISEFELLAEKVARLVALTHALRSENAGLRLDLASLSAHHADMQQRMQEAHERVAAVLAQLPVEEAVDEEAA